MLRVNFCYANGKNLDALSYILIYFELLPIAIWLWLSVICLVGKVGTFSDKRAEGHPHPTRSFQARKEAGAIVLSLLVDFLLNQFKSA